MRCPLCDSKDMEFGDWMRMTNQMRRLVTNPFSSLKLLRIFVADTYAHMYRCASCGHRFARCDNCRKKWPITSRTEAGDTTDCSACHERVLYVGRHFG